MDSLFFKNLIDYQKKINRELRLFFNAKISQTKRSFLKNTLLVLKEFSLRPAKRLRAILVNYGYFLAGGKNQKNILKTSIFFELIHNYLLIHDDIMDQDKIRRGGPTVHCSYRGSKHYGQSMALALGDMANALAHEILASSVFPDNYKIKAVAKLNQVLYSTGYGQMLEFWLKKSGVHRKINKKDILEIYRNKTALYTFVSPMQIGAMLAGASQEFLKKIEKFALPLGIAFQIKDDIQDRTRGSLNIKMAEKLINNVKENLKMEKIFPKKEKQFLFNLADYVTKRKD